MTIIKKYCLKTAILVSSMTVPVFFGEAAVSCPKGVICNPIPKVTSIPGLIKTILEGALKIGIPLLALAIIYSGFLFVVARGNSEKLEKAKDSLLYTIIGGAILLGSWAIAKMIESTVLGITS